MTRRAWFGLGGALVLIAAAILVPFLFSWNVHVKWFPPLHAQWSVRFGPGTIPAMLLAILAARFAVDLARRLPWWWLFGASTAASAAWMVSLALVDGPGGIGTVLDTQYEYLRTARAVTDVSATLHEFISRLPIDADPHWPVHVAGHPPGALLFFVALVQVGLGSGFAAGLVVIALAATIPAAVLVTLRRLGAETEARSAAPFLVFGTAAVWMAVSADAMFAAFAAWGLCCLALAATTRRRLGMIGWSAGAGLLLGWCVLLSYGLPLLGVLAVAVLVVARNWRPLPVAVVAASIVVLAFAANGFVWWQAYPVLVERYWDGVATLRPYGYWVWGNLAALALSAGPLLGAGLAVLVPKVRGLREATPGVRAIVLLGGAAVLTILIADLSGMSKAEVERIWLPFVPWLLLSTALLPPRWRRGGLILQVAFALVLQHVLATGW
jgi:hypothetical protein